MQYLRTAAATPPATRFSSSSVISMACSFGYSCSLICTLQVAQNDPHSQDTGEVNKAVDVFLELSCFFDDSVNVGNLISGSSCFSKPGLDIWTFLVHIMLKPSLQDFQHDLTSMGDECKCLMVRTLFSTTLLGN